MFHRYKKPYLSNLLFMSHHNPQTDEDLEDKIVSAGPER